MYTMWWMLLAMCLPVMVKAASYNTSMIFVESGDVLVSNDRWVLALDIRLDDILFGFNKIIDFEKKLINSVAEFKKQNEAREPSMVKNFVTDMIADWYMEINLEEQEYWNVRTQFDSLVFALIPKKSFTRKRAIVDFGGPVLKMLFGTMDNSDLISINGKLDKLQASNDHVQHMVKEQLSYIPRIELIMRNQAEFAQAITDITKTIQQQSKDLWYADIIRLHQHKFSTGIRTFSNLVLRMKEASNILVNALLTTNNGKIDPSLLKPGNFLKILKNVQLNMPLEYQFVAPATLENLHIFYDVGKSSAYLIGHSVRLYVEIPLKAQEREFTIYRSIPIPIPIVQNNLRMKMKTDNSYLALSKNKNLHFEMNAADYAACRGQFIKICPYNLPIYRRHNTNTCLFANYVGDHIMIKQHCEIIISKRTNAEWIKVDDSETWVHDLEKEDLNLICADEAPRHITVQGTGTLNIPRSCEVHGKNYLLIQNVVGKSDVHNLTLGILDTDMLTFLESIANFSASSMITIEENSVLDDIVNRPGWDMDFSKGVDIKQLKSYMDSMENHKIMNHTNYRVVALYIIMIVAILIYLSYLVYSYLKTMECIFRRATRPRRVYDMDSLNGIHTNQEEIAE